MGEEEEGPSARSKFWWSSLHKRARLRMADSLNPEEGGARQM